MTRDIRRPHASLRDRPSRSASGVVPVRIEPLNRLTVGKPLLVGPDPIRQNGKTGESVRRPLRPPPVKSRQARWQREQRMHLLNELVRRLDTRLAEVGPQPNETLVEHGLRRRPMVAGDSRNQGPPNLSAGPFRQLERLGGGIEQTQPPGTVVVVGRKSGRIVAKAIRIETRHLGLKLLGEFSDVVQTQQEADHADGGVSPQPQQESQPAARPAIPCQQSFSNRGHVDRVKCQGMPPRPTIRVTRPGLSPEAKRIHGRLKIRSRTILRASLMAIQFGHSIAHG